MISVLCLNPSFDRTVEVEDFTPGGTNRIIGSIIQAGGKGINVATCLERLGLKSCCVGCAGNENFEFFRALLRERKLEIDFCTIQGAIRINMKVVSRTGNIGVTELNESGPSVNSEVLQDVYECFCRNARKSDMAVITGSLPPGCPEGTYARFIRGAGVPCILDVGGKELLRGIESKPFLVKPNLAELEEAVNRSLQSIEEIREAAMDLCRRGTEFALVSLGAEGALIADCKEAWFAPALNVKVGSTVGAGDAMVSGLIAGWLSNHTAEAMLRHGVAAGAASVMTQGTGLLEAHTHRELIDSVEIYRI